MHRCDGSTFLSYSCNAGSLKGSVGGHGWAEAVAGGEQEAPPFNVLLTAYPLFERESGVQKLDRALLGECRWSHMVLVRPVCVQRFVCLGS